MQTISRNLRREKTERKAINNASRRVLRHQTDCVLGKIYYNVRQMDYWPLDVSSKKK